MLSGCSWTSFYADESDLEQQYSLPAHGASLIGADPSPTPAPTSQPSTRTVMFEPVEGYLPNPFMGWQDSRLQGEILPETVAYDRFNWADFNPARGEYDWSPIESLRNYKTTAGKLISFRIRTSRPAPFGPGPVIPSWVARLGAQIAYDGGSGPEPLYHDCIYLETHAQFIDALRQEYDGDPDIAFIDIGSYGSFGEWDSDQYREESETLDWHARRRIADMYIGGSGVRPCLSQGGEVLDIEYSYAGFQRTQLVMPFTPWFEDSLIYVLSKRKDVGIRQDSLGSERHQEYILERSAQLIESRWPYAPIVFEFSPRAFTEAALESARQFANAMHATYIHDNLDGRGDITQIRDVLASIGYRLYLSQATYRDELNVLDPLPIETEWENLGSAPPYFDAELSFVLQDSRDGVVFAHRTELDLRTWLPGESILLKTEIPLSSNLPAGEYTLKLAVVDGEGLPFVQLAMDGQDESGYHTLGSLQIVR